MPETTPNYLNEVIRLQRALLAVLPEEYQHLVADLEAAMNAQHVGFDDLLIRAIQGAADHVLCSDPDPELGCCDL